ncbi:type IV secretory system conjugative DNA transfer family protein [Candidatus Microgenomates bacterium]|nr:type IV secretory system conjugative DNA transfer family protein [Candidatus Microgenomates bacterium]
MNSASSLMDFVANFPAFMVGLVFVLLGLGILAGIGAAVVYIFLQFYKSKDREERALSYVTLQVAVPKDNEIKIDAMEQFFASLYTIFKSKKILFDWVDLTWAVLQDHVSFEIVGQPGDIRFYVSVPAKHKELIEKQIHGTYPGAMVTEVEDPNIFTEDGEVAYASMKLKSSNYFPIKIFRDLAIDPLSMITSSLAKLDVGESAAFQFVVAPADGKWKSLGRKFISKTKKNEADPEKARFNVDAKSLEAIESKTGKPGFNTSIRLVANSHTKEGAKLILDNMKSTLAQFSSDQNGFKGDTIRIQQNFMTDFIYRFQPLFGKASVLNSEELATIFHFPNKSIETPNIFWLNAKRAPAPQQMPDKGGIWIGNADFRGQKREVHILPPDRLRHVYIIGGTGVGKSVLQTEMMIQDIRNGEGVCFIDPHDTYEQLMELIPPERAEDVIYFSPANSERPMGLNLMEAHSEQERHMVVTGFIGLLYKLFDPHQTGIVGPRLEHSVRNAMLTVMEAMPEGTLIEVMRILQDPGGPFLQELLPRVQDQMVKRFWTEQIAATSEFHKSETLDYIVSKFGRFVTNRLIRNIIGQSKSSFNFREVMDQKKILIINLAKGLIGEENSSFLGSLIVPQILRASLSRQDVPMEKRTPFYLYVDEFQNFATPDFAVILSEARKYGLALTVGNQFMSQIEDDVKNAIIGNVGTIISFRLGVADAQFFSHQFAPTFGESDFLKVEAFTAYVKTLVNNEPVPYFSMNTKPDFDARNKARNPKISEMIKELSALKYGRDVREVEAEIASRSHMY